MSSEIDGDFYRTPALVLLELVRDFVLMSGRAFAGAGGIFRKDCSDLIRRIALLIHLAEEIGNFRGDGFEHLNESSCSCSSSSSSSGADTITSSSSDRVSELVAAIQAAKRLLYAASKIPRSDDSSVTGDAAKKLILQFQYVTTRLEIALANLPYEHFCISDEVDEQVDLVRAQLRRAAAKFGSLSSTSELPDKKINVRASGEWMVGFDVKSMGSSNGEEIAEKHHFSGEDDLTSKNMDDNRKSDEIVIPENFLCPISLELMTNPVVVSTGQTYERSNIQRWIDSGKTTCLKTQRQLQDLTLTPNFLLRRLITKWCIDHNVKLEAGLTNEKLNKFNGSFHTAVAIETLVRKLSRGLTAEKKAAVSETRKLSKSSTDYREQIAEAGAIPHLVSLLTSDDVEIQENAISSILNLSLSEQNKRLVMVCGAVPHIGHVLKAGSMEGRESAAATIYSLSLIDEYKITIGASGVIPDLLKILEIGSLRGKKDAARALLNLCMFQGNKGRAVRAGIITPLLKMLSDSDDSMVDEALYIMSVLCSHPEAKASMIRGSSMLALTELLKTGLPRSKENAAAVLLALCKGDAEKLARLVRLGAGIPLIELAKNGTERARRKAASLLDQLGRSRKLV